jgi:gluconate kinase
MAVETQQTELIRQLSVPRLQLQRLWKPLKRQTIGMIVCGSLSSSSRDLMRELTPGLALLRVRQCLIW